MCIYVYVYVCMCVYMYMYMCVYMYICICVYIRTYIRVYVCIYLYIYIHVGLPGGSVVKNPAANAGVAGSIPGLGRSPRQGNGSHSSILAREIP